MITLEGDRLVFRFPEVHEDAVCSISFQRTLRLPDDGRAYPLPPGLGRFPLRHLDDVAARLPKDWQRRGGVIMPMFQAEAMWLVFETHGSADRFHFGRAPYPAAIKVGTGKINAVTGEGWVDHLNRDPQDYVVLPEQPWLDGYCVEKGLIRQFVAMPLGAGYSVEEQMTGKARFGGLQLAVHPMKARSYRKKVEGAARSRDFKICASPSMGLAPGGLMRQEIYEDPYDLADWDQRQASRCFISIVNSVDWRSLTGEAPPMRAPTARDYAEAGLPWFEYYDADAKALRGAAKLARLRSVGEVSAGKKDGLFAHEDAIAPGEVQKVRARKRNRTVREPRC
jgi:hypothetical protein